MRNRFLEELYNEPHRYYHNLDHIKFMVDVFETKYKDFSNSYSIKAYIHDVIEYHDCIYNVKNKGHSNEVQSALFYMNYAEVPSDRILSAILATEYHFTNKEFENPLTNLLLDLDIYSFTLPYKDFKDNQKLVDMEFLTEFSQEEVDKGRLDFLSGIINDDTLRYRILPDKVELKEKARENIIRYLQDRYDVIL